MVDKRYVNNNPNQFRSAREVDMPFEATDVDKHILKDTSNYRVYEIQGRLQGRTSYFHKAVGGYSAVRPRRVDQLFEYNVEKNISKLGNSIDFQTLSFTKSNSVLDMLNVKYVIVPTGEGDVPVTNPFANGNAWFVEKFKFVKSADEEIKALDNLNTKKVAVINNPDFGPFFKPDFEKDYIVDSLAQIKLVNYKPNQLKYISNNANEGLAIFSEMYYEKGWNVYVDGEKRSMIRANYVLRALQIPAGKHTIEFKFEPEVVKTGSTIALISSIGMLLLIGAGVYFERKKKV